MISFTEENYLKAVYHLSGGGQKAVLTNELAEAMQTKAASVTDMIKKLSAKGLILYERYYGVKITTKGKAQALQIIRKHRLWETFLVEKLGFNWDEVHEVAEQLEHIQSPALIDKLDKFLGFPSVDPHGDPIPNTRGKLKPQHQVPLEQLGPGKKGTIACVKDSDPSLLKYLEKIGAKPGKKIQVVRIEDYDKSIEVIIQKKKVIVSKEVSKNILLSL
ncbi:MAG TPA: metal-dependent transcriptional regulator [Cyclobacteriaceae bacterium]|nr:metal-dependent transcriptional regulator [Cyclobacteriaceae bacterium]